MTGFEYKVVPAPMRGLKAKGIKGTQARFANALQTVMNEHGADGWEYQRTDTLPVEERQGLTGKTTSFQNMLVFRRALAADVEETAPEVAALIEDKTEEVIVVEAPATIAAADEVPEVEPEIVEEVAEVIDPTTLAAEDRVSETLKAPFVFPWNRRRMDAKSDAKPASDDDKHIPAE